jgi:hypothetical protein
MMDLSQFTAEAMKTAREMEICPVQQRKLLPKYAIALTDDLKTLSSIFRESAAPLTD